MEQILSAFAASFTPMNLWFCFLGVFIGTFIGVLPGLGAISAVAIMLPLSFGLDPTSAIILLAGVYYGGEYGGSTAAILLNIPGTPSSAVTCLDGYPMAQQGRAGVALFATTIASFIGGSLGIILMMVATPAVAKLTLLFGPGEYFALLVFGLLATGAISREAPLKGLAMVVLGVLVGCIGTDMQSGEIRYNLGVLSLTDGFHIVVVVLGLFGVSEVISSIRRTGAAQPHLGERVRLRTMIPPSEERRRMGLPILRGTAIGSLFGPLPGTGPMLASYVSYALEVRLSPDPDKFGKGMIEGISAPEASNNAAVQTSFIPMLALGIPGTATTAVILGALLIHGIVPGPMLVTQNPELFWGVVGSFWIGNLFLLILNIPFISLWVMLLKVPYRFMYPFLICAICIGAFSTSNNPIDMIFVLMFGIAGYLGKCYGYHPAPFLIGFLLGPMLEENFRRSMIMYRGDFPQLFTSPISGSLLALSLTVLVFAVVSTMRRRRKVS